MTTVLRSHSERLAASCQASKLPDLLAGTGSEASVDAKALWSRREESVIGTLVRHHIRYLDWLASDVPFRCNAGMPVVHVKISQIEKCRQHHHLQGQLCTPGLRSM